MDKNKNKVIGGLVEPFQRFFNIEASGGIVLLVLNYKDILNLFA